MPIPMPVVPYLPRTGGNVAPPHQGGEWQSDEGLLEALAVGLDVQGAGGVTAIPTIWARPLVFAEALLDPTHPMHEEVTREWRGLLGLLSFREIYGLTTDTGPDNALSAHEYKIPEREHDLPPQDQ